MPQLRVQPIVSVRCVLACVLLVIAMSGAALAASDSHTMVRFWIDNDADQAFIDSRAGTLDIASGRRGDHYDIVVETGQEHTLMQRGSRVEVLQQNLEDFYAQRLDSRGDFGVYHTFSENVAWMDSLHTQYPHLVSAKWSLGWSHEGRNIWCYRVSDNPDVDEDEPEILFDGMHHAREIMASEINNMLTAYLCAEYDAGNPEVIQMLNEREIYMVPIVNPDGFVYNETTNPNGGGMWRKNRRVNGDGTYGVDPNRNYSFHWGEEGASANPGDDTYRGPSPCSEPEVGALTAFINSRDFTIRQSWHSYSGLTLIPWGYTTTPTPDDDLLMEMGAEMCQYNGYAYGCAGDLLYLVSGGAGDWDYGATTEHSKILGFCNEIGWSSDGFWPAQNRRQPLFEDNLWPSLYLIQMAGLLRGVTFEHTPPPFTANAGADFTLAAIPMGHEGTLIQDDSVIATYRINGGDFNDLPMSPTGNPGEYGASIPPQPDGTVIEYYISAIDIEGQPGTSPRTAPATLYCFEVGNEFVHAMEADRGWVGSAEDDDASTGRWDRVEPVATAAQPGSDHSADGTFCWVTGQQTAGESIGFNDVDSGKTSLLSPVYDFTGADQLAFSYWKWFSNSEGSAPNTDYWDVYLSNDGGATWTSIEHTLTSTNAWVEMSFDFFSYFATPELVQVKFVASDEGEGSIVEAAIDDFIITSVFSGNAAGDTPLGFHVRLDPAYPNPFNPITNIRYTLPQDGPVRISIFNARGQLLRTLVSGDQVAGQHEVIWNGRDSLGRSMGSGVYFCRLQADGTELNQRLVLIK